MHEKSVLMCFNIPRGVNEDNLYELFCNAGPIESIQAGKSGKSVFICYEFRESVATAKELFKDLKLYGRPIRMFDKGDIEKIHAEQEEESNLKRPYETDDNYGYNEPPTKSRRYEGPALQYSDRDTRDDRAYRHIAQIPLYLDSYSRGWNQRDAAHSQDNHTGYPNHFPTSDSNTNHAERSTPKKDLAYRSDLMLNNKEHDTPTNDSNYWSESVSNNQQSRQEVFRSSDKFRNPYEMPVIRFNQNNSHRYGDFRQNYDKPYDRQRRQNYSQSHSSSFAHFSKNRHHNPERNRNYSHRDRRQ